VAFLGPEGTFSEEALLADTGHGAVAGVPMPTIYDAVMAVQDGRVDWSLVPIENSTEGSVSVTLDTLAREAGAVQIVGELVLAVRQCLIAREPLAPEEVTTVVTHPQAAGQCAGFLRSTLAHARVLAASSTADAVRMVSEAPERSWAALGTRLAGELYGCVVLAEGVEDRHDNETRFVWLAAAPRAAAAPPRRGRGEAAAPMKTSLVFWGPGADGPGWLVACLDEFARRAVNLTKIESRPRREQLGRYMFFLDLDGAVGEESVRDAVAGLQGRCQEVRVLGSYPAA
jgi:prephenate dehydratase